MASKRSGGVPLEGDDQPTAKRQTLRRLSTDNLSWPESTRPELRVSHSDPDRYNDGSNPLDHSPAVGDSIDLVSKIACLMKVGEGLFNLCVAVGPANAARIRYDYLLDNEEYLVHSLEVLNSSLLITPRFRTSTKRWVPRHSSLHLCEFPKEFRISAISTSAGIISRHGWTSTPIGTLASQSQNWVTIGCNEWPVVLSKVISGQAQKWRQI